MGCLRRCKRLIAGARCEHLPCYLEENGLLSTTLRCLETFSARGAPSLLTSTMHSECRGNRGPSLPWLPLLTPIHQYHQLAGLGIQHLTFPFLSVGLRQEMQKVRVRKNRNEQAVSLQRRGYQVEVWLDLGGKRA